MQGIGLPPEIAAIPIIESSAGLEANFFMGETVPLVQAPRRATAARKRHRDDSPAVDGRAAVFKRLSGLKGGDLTKSDADMQEEQDERRAKPQAKAERAAPGVLYSSCVMHSKCTFEVLNRSRSWSF